MVSVLKHNHHLEDLLFKEAGQLEMTGDTAGAVRRLDDALDADKVQKRSLRKIKFNGDKFDIWPPFQVFEGWVLEEDIDWSDIPGFNPIFSSGSERAAARQKRGRVRRPNFAINQPIDEVRDD